MLFCSTSSLIATASQFISIWISELEVFYF